MQPTTHVLRCTEEQPIAPVSILAVAGPNIFQGVGKLWQVDSVELASVSLMSCH